MSIAYFAERAQADTPWVAAGWSARGQALRYRAVLDRLQPRPGDSLLDYGCGHGYLCEFLPYGVRYTGVDRDPTIIERAAQDHGRHDASFRTTIPGESFDLVAAIGWANLHGDDAYADLEQLWPRCDRTLVASLYAGHDQRCRRYDEIELVEFARQLNAPRFAVDRHLTNDVLLILRRA